MEINKGHLAVAWLIIDAHIRFKERFREALKPHYDEAFIQKMMITSDLLNTPHKTFFSKDEQIIATLIGYVFWCLVHLIRENLETTLETLQRIMKSKVDRGELSNDSYIKYRRTNRELKTILDYVAKKGEITITIQPNFLSAIIV